jgi:DNA-binding GntR family transcriptional regulator
MNLRRKEQPVSDACEAQIFAIGDAPQKYKQHLAYDYLKESIISGKFPSNKPLIERELCDTLGVSRTPVREALRRLTSEGLVESFPGRGVFVAGVTLEKAIQMHEFREALERSTARLCAERMTSEEVWQLWNCIQDHSKAREKGEMAAAADFDLRFHVLIIEGAHSPMLEQQAKRLLLQTRRLSQLAVYDTAEMIHFIQQHTDIYQAIRLHDPEASERAVGAHIASIKKFQQERWKLLF